MKELKLSKVQEAICLLLGTTLVLGIVWWSVRELSLSYKEQQKN